MTETTKGLDISSDESSWMPRGKNYLFAIGINTYKHWLPLKNAVRDVEDFVKILTGRYQFEKKDVILLKNEDATIKNILAGLRKLIRKVTDQDNLVIYYSGHGHYDIDTKTGYWVPVDAEMGEEYEYQFINNAVILDRLKAINSLHTFLIVDSCFSGTLFDRSRASPKTERDKSRLVFTSGGAEVVSDGLEGGNSPFARGLLNYLEKNTDKHIRASRLIVDVKEYVERETQQKQTPMDGRLFSADDRGGDFVFHLKMLEAEIWADVVGLHSRDGFKKFLDQFPDSRHRNEAQEACDWLTAKEENTIQSLQAYLNTYQPKKGKYVAEAIRHLDQIEEVEFWQRAEIRNSLAAYYDYIQRYSGGRYVEEANIRIRQLGGKPKPPDGTDMTDDDARIPDDEKAWEKAKSSCTYISCLDFIQAYPESSYVAEAQQNMKRLDNIALNQIKLAEQNKNMSIQDKIEQCLNYFNNYPGADNNKVVKKIKDRLQIQKYSIGRWK